MREALLLFLGSEGGIEGWIRLAEGMAVERGVGSDGAPDRRSVPVVAVAPGEAVTLRWLDLPQGLSPAQAAGAARIMVAELCAQPVAELHVAVGRDSSGGRCVGLVPLETMRGWLDGLEGAGFDAERIVPATLLVPAPAEGLATWDSGLLRLYRGPNEAFAAEPELGDMLLAGRTAAPIDPDSFAAGLADAVDQAPLDLRQGPFARRRDWRVAPARARRLLALTAALLLITLAVQVAFIARYIYAADSADAETRRIAAAALPRSPGATDPGAALKQRLAELRGAGAGFRATAGALFESVKATPNVELTALAFSPDGLLRATVQADSPAAIEALRQRVEASGFAAESGAPRSGGARRVADLTVRSR
ncbi:MAG: ral secretion pathway protein [Sphingomonadales bacterium]|jgi:general secretion pathway protein L|nr:ral secretion pathway protein [Sphingomonadales bacterium]